MHETGLKLYALLEKASCDYSPANFTNADLANAKNLISMLNPMQLFDISLTFSLSQPTKHPDGKIEFAILLQGTNQHQNIFLMIKPDGSLSW